MSEAKKGDTVKVHYTGKLDDGTVFDTTEERDPIEFTVGHGQVIPGFEDAVLGMNAGDTKTETIPPDRAYGAHLEEMMFEVERTKIPENINPEVGQQLHVSQEEGQPIPVLVTEVSDTSITLDANHPLAGQSLTFEIQLVEVQH
jgi:peptidylprolyl isomerase